MGISAISVRRVFMENMKPTERNSMRRILKTDVSCSERKFLVVSMSDVQR